MIRRPRPSPSSRRSRAEYPSGSAYGPTFWSAYLANALLMVAWALLVRYADFVTYLGGAEGQLGMIVGVGMVGSLAMRLGQGLCIDRYGARLIWLVSLLVFVASIAAHLWVQSASAPAIFLLRILMQTSVAGVFGASITYVSRSVPPIRMAEIIGTLGSSGFIGILLGPLLGDWIFADGTELKPQLDRMFLIAAGLGGLSFVAAWAATRGQSRPIARRQPSLVAIMRRYHPGMVLLVAIAVGVGTSVPFTFLRTYANELRVANIGFFFSTYAITAFVVRMSTRHLFERFRNGIWVVCGLTAMATSMLLYLGVQSSLGLMIPGAAAGVAHALLFPAVVAGGSTSFPVRYRGLGTTLMLAMFDVGGLVGAPMIGGSLYFARQVGLPPYPIMFCGVAAGLSCVALAYVVRPGSRSKPDAPSTRDERSPEINATESESSPCVAP